MTPEFKTLMHNSKTISVHIKSMQLIKPNQIATQAEIFIEKRTTYHLRNEYSLLLQKLELVSLD